MRTAHGPFFARLRYILPEARATMKTMSKASEQINMIKSLLLPLQLGIAILLLDESAYFSVPYVDNQLLCSVYARKQSHAFNFAGFKHNNKI